MRKVLLAALLAVLSASLTVLTALAEGGGPNP